MNIFFDYLPDSKVEGLTKIAGRIKHHLLKTHKQTNLKQADIYHLNSGGIGPALKSYPVPVIYSLYSDLTFSWTVRMKTLIGPLFRGGDITGVARKIFFATVTCMIPLWYKRHRLSKMHTVVVPTKYIAKKLKLRQTKVIPFGIDTTKFIPPKVKNKKPVIAYIGSPSEQKGYRYALDAFMQLRKEGYDCRAYFSSTKNLDVKKYKKAGIHIEGPAKDIAKVYQSVDVVVLPYVMTTSSIGVPLVMIEAMATENIVITTKLPHVKEVGSTCVLYMNKLSAQEIVRLVHATKNKQSLRKQARRHVVENYEEKDMLKAYDKLYEDIEHGNSHN